MRTINFSDARDNLKAVFDRVVADADATIITRRDAEDVVVISLDTWNSWQETEYLLSNPANARHLAQSLAQLDAGQVVVRKLVEIDGKLEMREPAAKAVGRKSSRTHQSEKKKRSHKKIMRG